jgi:hypothetical protein
MGNSSISRCAQDGEPVSANVSNNASCSANDICADSAPATFFDATGGSMAGSQQNTTGWKIGDPICPVDRVSYTKKVADRILWELDQIDKKNEVWTEEEKKKVSASVAGIACNLHENYCLYEKVIEYAISGPLGRINYKAGEEKPK